MACPRERWSRQRRRASSSSLCRGTACRRPCRASTGTDQIVIDATNDWAADDLDGRTSSELVADLVAGARVVKAANTLGAEVLGSDPHEAGGRRVIFVSGDDADAKAEVVAVFEDAGFAAIDLGDLATGGAMQQIHRPLAGVNLIRL